MKKPAGRTRKKQIAMRLRDDAIALLNKMASRTNKTKTRILEEALYLHAKELMR